MTVVAGLGRRVHDRRNRRYLALVHGRCNRAAEDRVVGRPDGGGISERGPRRNECSWEALGQSCLAGKEPKAMVGPGA